MVDEGDEHLELVVGRSPAADGLVDGDDPEQAPVLVAHRHEERVLGVPRVRARPRLSLRHVARSERVPVHGAGENDIRAATLEALREKDGPVVQRPRVAEQDVPGLLVAVHGRHLEVVPGLPVEVDGDGPIAERLADRAGDSVEQRGKILTRPQ